MANIIGKALFRVCMMSMMGTLCFLAVFGVHTFAVAYDLTTLEEAAPAFAVPTLLIGIVIWGVLESRMEQSEQEQQS